MAIPNTFSIRLNACRGNPTQKATGDGPERILRVVSLSTQMRLAVDGSVIVMAWVPGGKVRNNIDFEIARVQALKTSGVLTQSASGAAAANAIKHKALATRLSD